MYVAWLNNFFLLFIQITSFSNFQVLESCCKIMSKFLLFCRAHPVWETKNCEVLNNCQNKKKDLLVITHMTENYWDCFRIVFLLYTDTNVKVFAVDCKTSLGSLECFLVKISKYSTLILVNFLSVLKAWCVLDLTAQGQTILPLQRQGGIVAIFRYY